MQIPDQTDVFVVDQQGQVNVFRVVGGNPWAGPTKIGPTGLAQAGAPLVAFRHIDQSQTDLCVVGSNGALHVFSAVQAAAWTGPVQVGPIGLAPPGAALAASRQFALAQTDLFVIDNNGQLNVFFVHETGSWHGPVKVGPVGFAPPGAALAAHQQEGLLQTDVFLVDHTGQLNVFFVYQGGPWRGPVKIGPAGLAPAGAPVATFRHPQANQTDVFVIDRSGQLTVFSVRTDQPWSGATKIGAANLARPGAHIAVGRQASVDQTDVFLVDHSGQINVFWAFQDRAWAGPAKIGVPGFAASGAALSTSQQLGIPQTDLFVCDTTGQLNVFFVYEAGPWRGPVAIGGRGLAPPGANSAVSEQYGVFEPQAIAPLGGLKSASNYFLADNCTNLRDVKVTIVIDQDLEAAPPTPGNQPGFAFQLNCSSPVNAANPSDPNWIVWQQYIIGVGGTTARCAVNNWTAASLSSVQTIDAPAQKIATLATPNRIPAGSVLSFELQSDGAGNITAAKFSFEPGGTSHTINLIGLPLTGGGKVDSRFLAPIVAFELNLVGPGDLKHTHFVSGSGSFFYKSSNFMKPLAALPSCVASGVTTGETSNSSYSTLPIGPERSLTQPFQVDPGVP